MKKSTSHNEPKAAFPLEALVSAKDNIFFSLFTICAVLLGKSSKLYHLIKIKTLSMDVFTPKSYF